MTINLKNFLNDKKKMSRMGEFQDLKQIDGLEISSVSADLYDNGRDDLTLFYFKEGANYAMLTTTNSIVSETINWNQKSNKKVNDGNGDFQISIKKTVWGNDDGKSALGLMPYIKLPTADNEIGNDKVEGGIIFPFSTNVSDAINLDLMFESR